jgi:hypothetical protein
VIEDGTFVGALHARRQFDGLTLAETSYGPALVVPAHAHSSALVTLVLDGGLTEERGHRRATAEKGALIYHPPSEPHGHRFSELGGRCFVLQYGTEWLGRMRAFGMSEPAGPIDLRRTRANWLAGQVYREFQAADPAARLGIEGFAIAMLGELARLLTGTDRSLSEIAHTAGFADQAHFSRVFTQVTGSTPGQYRRVATGG